MSGRSSRPRTGASFASWPACHAASRRPPGTFSRRTSRPSSYGPAAANGPRETRVAPAAWTRPLGLERLPGRAFGRGRRSALRFGSSTVPLEQIGHSETKRLWRQNSDTREPLNLGIAARGHHAIRNVLQLATAKVSGG